MQSVRGERKGRRIFSVLAVLLLSAGFFVLADSRFARAQQGESRGDPSQQVDTSDYVNLGMISYSPKVRISEDGQVVMFKIRNNVQRSISQLFCWVYRIPKTDDKPGDPAPKKEKKLILINNPHQSALTTLGIVHMPGKIEEWRFVAARRIQEKERRDEFILKLSPRSIFFAPMEPGGAGAVNPGKKP